MTCNCCKGNKAPNVNIEIVEDGIRFKCLECGDETFKRRWKKK